MPASAAGMVLAAAVGACVLKPERSHNGDAAAASRVSERAGGRAGCAAADKRAAAARVAGCGCCSGTAARCPPAASAGSRRRGADAGGGGRWELRGVTRRGSRSPEADADGNSAWPGSDLKPCPGFPGKGLPDPRRIEDSGWGWAWGLCPSCVRLPGMHGLLVPSLPPPFWGMEMCCTGVR